MSENIDKYLQDRYKRKNDSPINVQKKTKLIKSEKTPIIDFTDLTIDKDIPLPSRIVIPEQKGFKIVDAFFNGAIFTCSLCQESLPIKRLDLLV